MKFFIPAAKDAAQEKEVYEGTWKFVSQQMGAKLSPRMIYRLEFVHNGKKESAIVGEKFDRMQERVIVILYDRLRDLYLVCTPNRGVLRGEPYLVGGDEVQTVEDFEP